MTKFEVYMDGDWYYSDVPISTAQEYVEAFINQNMLWLKVTKKGIEEYINAKRITRIRIADVQDPD